MSIRPAHPEHTVTLILALHRRCVERIDRLRAAGYTLHEHLEAASTDLDELDRMTIGTGPNKQKLPCSILELVLQRTLDAAPGSPRAQALDGQGGTVRTDEDGHIIMRSDPTGDGATQPDDGARDRREIIHHLEAIQRHLTLMTDDVVTHSKVCRRSADRIVCITLNWLPRDATDSERHEAQDGEPGCEAHAALRGRKGPDGAGWWQAVAHEWRGGLLGQPAALCSACHSRAKATGSKPSADDCATYNRTGKWPKRHEERKAS